MKRNQRRLAHIRGWTGSNLLQAVVTLLVAIVLTVSALLASQASGMWHEALRQQIQRSAAILETVRHVYADEAPEALRVAVAEARAAQLRLGLEASAAEEGAMETQVAWHERQAHLGSGTILDGDHYRLPALGYDVPRRLSDARRTQVGPDPEARQWAGDRAGERAWKVGMLAVPLVVLYLVGQAALLARRRSMRKRDRRRQDRARDVGLAPEPERRGRFAVTLGILAWLAVNLLSPVYAYAQIHEQRAQLLAAVRADQVSAAIAGSGLVFAFQLEGQRAANALELRSAAREYVSLGPTGQTQAQHEIAIADQAAAGQVRAISKQMGRLPAATDGVDRATLAIVRATPADWRALLAEQVRQAVDAERAGKWGNYLGLSLLLVALTATLGALAEVTGPERQSIRIRRIAAAMLLGAVLLIAVGALS